MTLQENLDHFADKHPNSRTIFGKPYRPEAEPCTGKNCEGCRVIEEILLDESPSFIDDTGNEYQNYKNEQIRGMR